ncbi:MAG: hypothetical protein ACRC2R_10840 [Xenococcaceae cyanobacterium]
MNVAQFPVKTEWQYSLPVTGNCFRFRFQVINLNPVRYPWRAIASVAYQDGGHYYHHAITKLYNDPNYRLLMFEDIVLGLPKHIAIKGLEIARLPVLWLITVDTWDSYVEIGQSRKSDSMQSDRILELLEIY